MPFQHPGIGIRLRNVLQANQIYVSENTVLIYIIALMKLPQSHPLESNGCVNHWEKLNLVRMGELSHCFQQFSSVLNATENENKAAALSGLSDLSLLSYTQQTETTRLTTVIYMWFLKWTWEFIPLLSCTCMCGLYVVYAHSGKPEDTSLLLSLSALPQSLKTRSHTKTGAKLTTREA